MSKGGLLHCPCGCYLEETVEGDEGGMSSSMSSTSLVLLWFCDAISVKTLLIDNTAWMTLDYRQMRIMVEIAVEMKMLSTWKVADTIYKKNKIKYTYFYLKKY